MRGPERKLLQQPTRRFVAQPPLLDYAFLFHVIRWTLSTPPFRQVEQHVAAQSVFSCAACQPTEMQDEKRTGNLLASHGSPFKKDFVATDPDGNVSMLCLGKRSAQKDPKSWVAGSISKGQLNLLVDG